MGDVTSPDNLPYPFDTDLPDIPADFKALADAAQAALLKGIPIFIDESQRDLEVTAPVDGQTIWVTSLGQQQAWSSTWNMWLPTGGFMPFGAVGAITALSVGAGQVLKIPFTGAAPRMHGGVTWNASRATFSGPPGEYVVMLRSICYASTSSGAVDQGLGTGDARQAAYGGGYIAANAQVWQNTTVVRRMNTTNVNEFAYYFATSAARNIGYNLMTITYNGWSI